MCDVEHTHQRTGQSCEAGVGYEEDSEANVDCPRRTAALVLSPPAFWPIPPPPLTAVRQGAAQRMTVLLNPARKGDKSYVA
jgi:hypothetical protein